jgi:hypothetical protein
MTHTVQIAATAFDSVERVIKALGGTLTGAGNTPGAVGYLTLTIEDNR